MTFTKLNVTEEYDQARIEFRAHRGMLVDLDKLHASLRATRLSGRTSSGVIFLEVTAFGEVEQNDSEFVLRIEGTDRQFILVDDVEAKPDEPKEPVLPALRDALSEGNTTLRVTGYVEGWFGRWPEVLQQPPEESPRLMVTGFENAEP